MCIFYLIADIFKHYTQYRFQQELLTLREHLSSPPVFLVGSVLLIFLFLCVMCIYVLIPRCDVRYDFHIKRCSVCLYLQLFVEGPISYLRYLCLCAYSGVFVLFVCLSSSYVPYVASFSGLSMFICLFDILQRLFLTCQFRIYSSMGGPYALPYETVLWGKNDLKQYNCLISINQERSNTHCNCREHMENLQSSIIALQCRSMKNNLIFTGLYDVRDENTEELLMQRNSN